jgi:hypothetical protein
MKIPSRLQTELTDELYRCEIELLNQIKSISVSKESDVFIKTWLRGKLTGLTTARMVINAWNEPNHGKVKAQLN